MQALSSSSPSTIAGAVPCDSSGHRNSSHVFLLQSSWRSCVRGRSTSFSGSSWRLPYLQSLHRSVGTPVVVCKVPNITQDAFSDEVLKSDSPVLVGFCADWCGPCKLIGPVIDTVAKDLHGSLKAVKIDIDTSPDLVKEYDVYGLPTLILFKGGKEVPNSRREGAINAKKLKALLDELLVTTTSP